MARGALTLLVTLCACVNPPADVGDFCSPAASECADNLRCCSIDPAAIDFDDPSANVLPDYLGQGAGGTPIFSDLDNDRSRRGVCIRPGTVPSSGRVPSSECPIPCNPTWSNADIQAVCGPNTICCQHAELEAKDCVLDPTVGDNGCWRPVTGADIGVLSNWGASEHATHQDPGLLANGACASLVAGLSPELDANAVRSACERRLTVANQQGFCHGGAGVNYCPEAQPSYRDACERLNDEQARSGCG